MAYKNNSKKIAFWAILAILGISFLLNFGGVQDKFWMAEYNWEHPSNGAPGPEKLTTANQTTYQVEQPDGTIATWLSAPNPNYFHEVKGIWMITKASTSADMITLTLADMNYESFWRSEDGMNFGEEVTLGGEKLTVQDSLNDQTGAILFDDLKKVVQWFDKARMDSKTTYDSVGAIMIDRMSYFRTVNPVHAYRSNDGKHWALLVKCGPSDYRLWDITSSLTDAPSNKDSLKTISSFKSSSTGSKQPSSETNTGADYKNTETVAHGYQPVTGPTSVPSTSVPSTHGYQQQT